MNTKWMNEPQVFLSRVALSLCLLVLVLGLTDRRVVVLAQNDTTPQYPLEFRNIQ